jgi:hypothetical protein
LALRLGGLGADAIEDVVADPDGSVYVAGRFTGTVDFDPGPDAKPLTSLGGADVFLGKFTSSGSLVWVAQVSGTANETVASLARDAAGNLLLAGSFEGSTDFDPGPGLQLLNSLGGTDGYVAKISPTGGLVWAHRFGGPAADLVASVTVDGSGNVYAAGSFFGRADPTPAVGPSIVSNGIAQDGFLLSFDAAGAVRWAFPIGGPDTDQAVAVKATGAGAIVVAGSFRGTASFSPDPAPAPLASAGGSDAFVASYTTGGVLRWARALAGPEDADVRIGGLAADATDGIAVSGNFAGTTDFDPGPNQAVRTSLGGTDWYLARYDGNGLFLSAFSVGGAGTDAAPRIAYDLANNLVVVGSFEGPVNFNAGAGSTILNSLASGGDVFAARYTTGGGLLWVSRIGDAASAGAAGTAIASDAHGDILIGGRFTGSPDFDPGSSAFRLTSFGETDGFLVKLALSGALALTP